MQCCRICHIKSAAFKSDIKPVYKEKLHVGNLIKFDYEDYKNVFKSIGVDIFVTRCYSTIFKNQQNNFGNLNCAKFHVWLVSCICLIIIRQLGLR